MQDSILCGKSNPAPIMENRCRKIAEQSEDCGKNSADAECLVGTRRVSGSDLCRAGSTDVVTHRLPAQRLSSSETSPKSRRTAERSKNAKSQAQSFHQPETHRRGVSALECQA
ncbi:MAG: hypothetical protein NC247_06580 [Ruminococcus flavefaciens]|nr:hypothetical protein [Ruminococcus flavefaciens]MCM1363301.1 hypothetical protein [Clostridiales bacterium]